MLEHRVQPNDRHGLALKHLMHTQRLGQAVRHARRAQHLERMDQHNAPPKVVQIDARRGVEPVRDLPAGQPSGLPGWRLGARTPRRRRRRHQNSPSLMYGWLHRMACISTAFTQAACILSTSATEAPFLARKGLSVVVMGMVSAGR